MSLCPGTRAAGPRATLRLQLHAGYTLDDVRGDLPYFSRLGVSHLYLSPVSQARRASTHGYDVVDHGRVDAARGGEEALRRLAGAARRAGMGILLDIVPNHMAADPDNAWWWDVLARGRESAWAACFDIDWDASSPPGRILAPFLARPYADALRRGDIRLVRTANLGPHIVAHEIPYPLAPASLAALGEGDAMLAAHDPARAEGRARLHDLLERQHYRLADWRCAARHINWRRFFEVSGLIGVRVECPRVFDLVHDLPLRLYAEGIIDGLRIDHVDGLAWPLAYCRRLRAALEALRPSRPSSALAGPPWVVVEKILAPGESLDDRWAADGTTGYDFAGDVGALQHDGRGESPLFAAWARLAGDGRPARAWRLEARQEMLDRHFIAERNALLDALLRRARADAAAGVRGPLDTPRVPERLPVGRALDALLRHFPTYRSYVEEGPRTAADRFWFGQALEGARADADGGGYAALLPLLDRWLGGAAPVSANERRAVRAFQQLTPPLAAKSLEDTVFYRYGCLLSRNEVGSDPAVFALTPDAFHAANVARAARTPRGLLATATHDHKRGEDARARLAVLSEIPGEWLEACGTWLDEGAGDAASAVPAFRYMLLQTLAGGWPPGLSATDAAGLRPYFDRVAAWVVKALREGKQLSGWFDPDPAQEEACLAYLESMAPGGSRHDLLTRIEDFVRRIEPGAIANGLIQAALRLTCPGIPDLYQGTEFRDFSLVDPDNRRPVDFAARSGALRNYEEGRGGAAAHRPLFDSGRWPAHAWADGRVKQALVAELLGLRRRCPEAFEGGYRPLAPIGGPPGRLLAFGRGDSVLVIAGVKCAAPMRFDATGMPSLGPAYWEGAALSLPAAPDGWRDVLRGRRWPETPPPRVAELLAGFPLAVLCRE
ncbi:malto-oligosyltrehalose synthase [Alcaligenaceae bacterium]|nr:malto-oligosyltrehalose synthase [Alcaligenaceae bacterium]